MPSNNPSRRAFLTGSFAYGTPRKTGPEAQQSDIDLVVLLSEEDMEDLRYMADNRTGSGARDSLSLRFGKLNLICECREDKYDAWRNGTKALKKIKKWRTGCWGATRLEAVDLFKNLFEKLGRTVFSFDFRRATTQERRQWAEDRARKVMDRL